MNRAVITGMGVVTPLGNDLVAFRDCLLAGRSGIRSLSLFPAGALPSHIAGECTPQTAGFKDRKILFALEATRAALVDAGFDPDGRHRQAEERLALSLGIGLELFDVEDLVSLSRNGYETPAEAQGRVDFLQTPADRCADALGSSFGLQTPHAIHISACAAGTDAIGHACRLVRRGAASVVLAGGTDSMLNPMGLAGFCRLGALSTRNNQPERASRPFDRDRDGFVLGEGSGMLVVEDLEHAVRRGARIYAELVGYGNSFDAYSVSDPHPEGRGALLAMERAVRSAGIAPKDISCINAHGTSTPKNDPVETLAIRRLLDERAPQVPISATKSMIGHLISAAGAVETIAAIMCACSGYVHATINLENPDPLCDLDYVPGVARPCRVEYILKNSFAFGGQNAALVLRMNEEVRSA
jgi:3-oxoacyl-[acyl-carrier-protein] synthase II